MKKALIVDDEENARLYLAKMIAVSFPEMEIRFGATPTEALFILKKFKPDILFLDVEMPGMSGLEMLQILREEHSETPVMIVSAYYEFEYVKKALRLDVVDYLNKPVDPDELELAINKIVDKNVASSTSGDDHKITLNTDKGTLYITPNDLLYFEANKRTSTVYFTTDERGVLVRENLLMLEKRLPQNTFQRVSRQYIINTKCIKFVNKNRYIVLQANNRQIKLDKIFPHVIEKYTK
ncbi:MAG: response regulator [Paludibacteraceae bacterium]